MNDQQFDRLARVFSRVLSRRGVLVGVGGVLVARSGVTKAASQIETAACGEAGAVCTELKGCCSGLVCATSYTNPAYGVCVTGEGDMLPVSDDIVVPGAEGIEGELAQEVTSAASGTTATGTGLAATDAEIEARKAAQDTRQSSQRSRHATQQSRRRANHGDTHEKKLANQTEKRNAADLRGAPHLKLKFSGDPNADDPETLKVRNLEDVAVAITRVESIHRPGPSFTATITIPAGETRVLYSGPKADAAATGDSQAISWADVKVCTNAAYAEGIVLTAHKSGASRTHRLVKRCS